MQPYDHKKIEEKWQKFWEKEKIFQAKDPSIFSKQKKYYTLFEFPFPSGQGLHVGHMRPYIGMDVISRKRRMEGFNVLFPIGWDAFGLPTENYAIKTGKSPKVVTKENTDNFRKQIKSVGPSLDWSREIDTTDPAYYKWTQWIFLQMYKKGLAYKKKMLINWCPKDKIGLANEEVVDGKCERCGTAVEKREKEQWMLAITKYADRLDKDLDTVDYQERIKTQQRNWIGKSEGAEIGFRIYPTPQVFPDPSPKGRGTFGYHTTDPQTWKHLQERVLEMRKNPTKAEDFLWESLKNNNLGFHFRRQHIIGNFITDFVCLEKSLVIEVDGDIHDYQKKEDEERTDFLKQQGFNVIRFKNDDVLENLQEILQDIRKDLKALPFGEGLGEVVKVFTTRPDTLFGVTYLVLAPEHTFIQKIENKIENIDEVKKYIESSKKKNEVDRTDAKKEKTGIELKGVKAMNPATGEEIPVFVADYVLAHYGTGAIMAVPAHDERDFEFAKKYGLPMKEVLIERLADMSNPHVPGKEIVFRDAVIAVVRNPKTNKYLCLKWKKQPWTTFVMGGMEGDEDPVDASIREIQEETGYKNIKFVKRLRDAQSEFFAAHKGVNRVAHTRNILFELENEEKQEVATEEKEIHDLVWLSLEEVKKTKMTHSEMHIILDGIEGKDNVFIGEGIIINSDSYSRKTSDEAKKLITEKYGKIVTTYKLRDWVFSRQRYWGEPIPMVHCENCAKNNPETGGWVPIPEKDLPVELPEVEKYQPTDTGESPLASISEWVNVKCPVCKSKATRETDTMPNWAGSSWYYLRYTDAHNKKVFADNKKLKYWTPVDWYNGGMEHTTLHLLYSRFWHKFLFDQGLVPTSEPYTKRTSHGLILAEGGVKMSKSLGNVVNPDEIVGTYGADTFRLYEMFMGPFDQSVSWSSESIIGSRRFLERVWGMGGKTTPPGKAEAPLLSKAGKLLTDFGNNSDEAFPSLERRGYAKRGGGLESLLHKTIKKVSEDIEAMQFNTAVSALMILSRELEKLEEIPLAWFETFLKLLSPFAPHMTEELWAMLGNKKPLSLEPWPKFELEKLDDSEYLIVVQVNGKVRTKFTAFASMTEEDIKNTALKMPEIEKWLSGKKPEKVIYVKNKLVNIVLGN